jgi:hypothetical protein
MIILIFSFPEIDKGGHSTFIAWQENASQFLVSQAWTRLNKPGIIVGGTNTNSNKVFHQLELGKIHMSWVD